MKGQQQLIISYAFKPCASATNAVDVEIYDEIGETYDWWTDTTTGLGYQKFKDEWQNAIANFSRVNVRINSVGGQVDIGNAMFNLMTKSAADKNIELHTYNDGVAYSMAAILMQAAPKGNRHSAKNALYMLHSAHTSVFEWGMNATKMRELADIMDKYDESLASSLADNLGITLDEVMTKYFDGVDHYYTADQAKTEGLIDSVDNYKSKEYTTAKDITSARADYMRIAASRKQASSPEQNILASIENLIKKYSPFNNKQTTVMADLKAIQAKFNDAKGKEITLTADEVTAFTAELQKYSDAKYTEDEVSAKVKAKEEEMQKTIDEKDGEIEKLEETIERKDNPEGGAGGGTPDAGAGNSKKQYVSMSDIKGI